MINPLVSIIVSAYNHEKYVEQAILSVISQTYSNIEFIIVDDGSRDNTANVIEATIRKHPEIKIDFSVQSNKGISRTLNDCIQKSRGEYIAILASDDAYLPKRIEEGVKLLSVSSQDIGAVYSDGFIIDQDGNTISTFSNRFVVPFSNDIFKELLIGNWVPAMGILYKRKAIIECGLFDENIKIEDYDLLLRLAAKFKILYINKKLFLYRQHGHNFSENHTEMQNQFDLIALKHPELKQYRAYIHALKSRDFYEINKSLSPLNFELSIRKIVRVIQSKCANFG